MWLDTSQEDESVREQAGDPHHRLFLAGDFGKDIVDADTINRAPKTSGNLPRDFPGRALTRCPVGASGYTAHR